MPSIYKSVEVEFYLEDYEDDIVQEYCNNDNCLKDCGHVDKLKDYIKNIYDDIFLYQRNTKDLNTVVEELERIIR